MIKKNKNKKNYVQRDRRFPTVLRICSTQRISYPDVSISLKLFPLNHSHYYYCHRSLCVRMDDFGISTLSLFSYLLFFWNERETEKSKRLCLKIVRPLCLCVSVSLSLSRLSGHFCLIFFWILSSSLYACDLSLSVSLSFNLRILEGVCKYKYFESAKRRYNSFCNHPHKH